MSLHRDRLLDAIQELYDSATDPGRWPTSLGSIGALLNGSSVNLLYHDHRARGGVQIAVGADPELYRWYGDYGHTIDPWATAVKPAVVPAGSVWMAGAVVDHASMKKTEFYAVSRGFDCTRAIVGVLEASPYQTAALTVNRGDRADEFDASDARVISVLLPHLRRTLAIQRRLGVLANQRAPLLNAIDALGLGVVLVDGRGRPILVNRYAARIVDARDGLAIENGTLMGATPGVTGSLARALGAALAVSDGSALSATHTELVLPRPAGGPALQVAVCPFRGRDAGGPGTLQAAAVVFIVDPEMVATPASNRLRALYSLTDAEARVAAALASGQSAADISEQFAVSRETARSHIKRIFEKANVRSQSAFIRLASTDALRTVQRRAE